MLVRPLFLAALVAGVAFSATAYAQRPTKMRVADVVIAGIPAKADSALVRRLLGNPDSVALGDDPSESGELPAWWYHDLEVVFLFDGTVTGEWIRGPSRATARGLRIGASRAEVVRLYGPPGTASDTTLVYLTAHRQGAPGLFVYVSAGRVSAIYAGRITD